MTNRKTLIVMIEQLLEKCELSLDAKFDGGSHWLIGDVPFCLLKYSNDMRTAEIIWSNHSLDALSRQENSNWNFHVHLRNREDVRKFSKQFSIILQKTRCSLYQCVSNLNVPNGIKDQLYNAIDDRLIHKTGEQNEYL